MIDEKRYKVTCGSVEVLTPECYLTTKTRHPWRADNYEVRKDALMQQLTYQQSLLEELREEMDRLMGEMADTRWELALETYTEKRRIMQEAKGIFE